MHILCPQRSVFQSVYLGTLNTKGRSRMEMHQPHPFGFGHQRCRYYSIDITRSTLASRIGTWYHDRDLAASCIHISRFSICNWPVSDKLVGLRKIVNVDHVDVTKVEWRRKCTCASKYLHCPGLITPI